MARDFIKISLAQPATAIFAGDLKRFIDHVRNVLDEGDKLLGVMGRNHDGTVFSDIETVCGLPASSGQTVFDLVNGTIGSLKGVFQTANALELIDRVG